MHASQATLHALYVVIDIGRTLYRFVVFLITHTTATFVPGLQTSHSCGRLVDLIESVRRPRIRGSLYFWRSHVLQRGHDIVHGIRER